MRLLGLFQGDNGPRNPEATGKLQILQQFKNPSAAEGNKNQSDKDSPMYVGIVPHTLRLANEKWKRKERKRE